MPALDYGSQTLGRLLEGFIQTQIIAALLWAF